MRTPKLFREGLARRAAAAALTLIVIAAALAGGLAARTQAADGPAGEPLLPNTPVALTPTPAPQGAGQAGGTEGLLPDPFAAGDPDPAALRAAVDSYLAAEQARASLAPADAAPVASLAAPVYLPLVRAQAPITYPPTPTATPDERRTADVAVALWAEPSIRVARGGLLTIEVRVRNYGRGAALRTDVELPYDRSRIVPVSSQLDSGRGDWVSELTSERLTVTFGEVGAGQERSGKVTFRVAGGLADNTVLSLRATSDWSDERRSSSGTTNWAPVLVGGGSDTAAYVWLIVDPAGGSAATARGFYSDRFIPGEGVTTWLNVPGGTTKALDVRGSADASGRVWLSYRPEGLAPGTYQLVVYGNRSKLIGVVSFSVK